MRPSGPTARSTSRWRWPASPIAFGTRHLDTTERHEGMVAAIAFGVGGQAAGLRGRGRVRHLGPVRRLRRPVASRARPPPRCRWCWQGGGRPFARPAGSRWCCWHAVGHPPAAPVPGDGGRERRRTPPAPRRLGVSGLPAGDQRVRAAHRAGRSAARLGPAPRNAETFVLSLPLAGGALAGAGGRSSAGCRPPPAWSSSRPSRCRRWSATTSCCRCC